MPEKWKNNHFVMEINGIESPGIDEVQGISLGGTTAIEVVDAGTNVADKISAGIVKWPPLVVIRLADGSATDQLFLNWFKETFDYNDPITAKQSTARRNGAIIKREYGAEVARFAFVGAWIREITFSDLASKNEDVAKWTINIEHAGIYVELL